MRSFEPLIFFSSFLREKLSFALEISVNREEAFLNRMFIQIERKVNYNAVCFAITRISYYNKIILFIDKMITGKLVWKNIDIFPIYLTDLFIQFLKENLLILVKDSCYFTVFVRILVV